MKLLKSQKNDVYRAVKEAGFSASDFEWKDIPAAGDNVGGEALRYRHDDYYFRITRTNGDDAFFGEMWVCEYAPGSEDMVVRQYMTTWKLEVVKKIEEWLKNLEQEIEPDLWSQEALGALKDENEKFTGSEQATIISGLQEVKQMMVESSDKSEEAMRRIGGEISRLELASNQIAKKDWLMMFVGVIVSMGAEKIITMDWREGISVLVKAGMKLISG